MEKGGVDGHVTVLCLIIYLGYRVSLAIWHTEFVFFRGCPVDLVSTFKLRRKQCCPKSSLLTFPTLACVFFCGALNGRAPLGLSAAGTNLIGHDFMLYKGFPHNQAPSSQTLLTIGLRVCVL